MKNETGPAVQPGRISRTLPSGSGCKTILTPGEQPYLNLTIMSISWRLEDAAALATQAKYTFYRPSQASLQALSVGQQAKLIFAFESDNADLPEEERLWVEITARDGANLSGRLLDEPFYIEDLKQGDTIRFETRHIIATDQPDPEGNPLAKYAHRCLVSRSVLEGDKAVGYLFRVDSLGEFKKGIVDSGWRILSGDETQDFLEQPDSSAFVALGVLLNRDERLLPLLDAPVGSAFEWNEAQQRFESVEGPENDS